MNKKLRKILIILLTVIFIASSGMFLLQLYQQHVADKAYDRASQIALSDSDPDGVTVEHLPDDSHFLLDLDLSSLQAENPDVMGWIHIPDSKISYPLLRSKDNKEYLKLTWDLTSSAAGSIFLEHENNADFSDFNTLIYGHNMKNGSMFSQLHDYQDQTFADSHPYVYIVTEDKVLQYEVFSAYTADVNSDTYLLVFEDDAVKQSSIDNYITQSAIHREFVPTSDDRILTLSTCTGRGNYRYRWVVQTALVDQFDR